jgi:hypothetical protein
MKDMTANENVNSDNISEWFVVDCAKPGQKQVSNSRGKEIKTSQYPRNEILHSIPEK